MESAELVAIGIAKIREIELAEAAFAIAGRILDRPSPSFDTALVPGVDFLGGVEIEADGAAVCMSGGLSVDRRCDHEHGAVPAIGDASALVGLRLFLEQSIVEFLRPPHVVRTDHDVTEH